MKAFYAGLIASAVVAAPAQAHTRPGFELRAELLDYGYRERDEGATIVRDDGFFGRGGIGYVETIGSGLFLRARLDVALGSVDYRGAANEVGNGPLNTRIENVEQSIGQIELHFGKDFVLAGGTTITPFIGLGSRVLLDESGGRESNDGLLGYDREVSYGYVPVGAAVRFALGPRSALILSGQYNRIVTGDVKSRFSQVDPLLPDVTVDLDKGHGLEFSLIAELPVGGRTVAVGPFIRHWNVSRSSSFILTDPEGSGEALELFEPRNRTTEIGLRLSVPL